MLTNLCYSMQNALNCMVHDNIMTQDIVKITHRRIILNYTLME